MLIAEPGTGLPVEFILNIDGVGSFLVMRQPIVTIGPIGSAAAPEIGLMADVSLPPIRVERLDEDYFLRPAGNGPGKLLANGERIELSPRCRLTFTLPSPISTSAVLDLSGARLSRPDIRRIILMDEDLIIGPGSASHVPGSLSGEMVVLHVRREQLFCRTKQSASKQPIVPGVTMKAGGLSFVIAHWPKGRG